MDCETWTLSCRQEEGLEPEFILTGSGSKTVAGLCIYLASDAASYVTGQAIHVNGGAYMS